MQDFGAFTSLQVEMGGSTRSGTQMVPNLFSFNDFCVSYLHIVCLLKLASFPALDLFCRFGSFVWLSACSDVAPGEQNINTRPSLPLCQLSLAYSNITPTVTRHCRITYRKLIFVKESSLFPMSALIALHRSCH